MKRKENRKLQMVFFMASMAVLVVAYLFLNRWMEQTVVRRKVLEQAVAADSNMLVDITEVKEKNETLLISGWTTRLDAELLGVKVILLPVEQDAERAQVLTASLNSSRDLKKYMEYLEVEEITGSGFTAEIDKEKLMQDVCYEIQVYANYELEKEQVVKVASIYNSTG